MIETIIGVACLLFFTPLVAAVHSHMARKESNMLIPVFSGSYISLIQCITNPVGDAYTDYRRDYRFVYTYSYFRMRNPGFVILALEKLDLTPSYFVFSSIDVCKIRAGDRREWDELPPC